jgi:hypothetical protein
MSTGMFAVVMVSLGLAYFLGALTGYLCRWASELLQVNNQLFDMVGGWEETGNGEEVVPGDEWKYN